MGTESVKYPAHAVFAKSRARHVHVMSLNLLTGHKSARYHTFVEIDHEIISTVILLPSADLFKKGCCQLQAKVCAQITG